MSQLKVSLIDVGWGDSLFLESIDLNGGLHYALIDSNDVTNDRSSETYIKRYLNRKQKELEGAGEPVFSKPIFDWVLLTHAHSDHASGLKRLLKLHGARRFWYPKTNSSAAYMTDLLRYAQNSSNVQQHESIDTTKILPDFGNVQLKILWPPRNHQQSYSNENNNSVVLALTLQDVCVVLTGDAEAEVWDHIADQIPANTHFFKYPHHGSSDSLFNSAGNTRWLDRIKSLSQDVELAITTDGVRHGHPPQKTLDELEKMFGDRIYYRTDHHYHIELTTDGTTVDVKYSH